MEIDTGVRCPHCVFDRAMIVAEVVNKPFSSSELYGAQVGKVQPTYPVVVRFKCLHCRTLFDYPVGHPDMADQITKRLREEGRRQQDEKLLAEMAERMGLEPHPEHGNI